MTKSLIASLMVATLAVMAQSIMTGAVLAHEDRESGGYKLVVGFLHEPAYEGERNAVSLRVTKEGGEDEQEEPAGTASMDMSGHHSEMSQDAIESEVPISVSITAGRTRTGGWRSRS